MPGDHELSTTSDALQLNDECKPPHQGQQSQHQHALADQINVFLNL
jgi:hypothetical protein